MNESNDTKHNENRIFSVAVFSWHPMFGQKHPRGTVTYIPVYMYMYDDRSCIQGNRYDDIYIPMHTRTVMCLHTYVYTFNTIHIIYIYVPTYIRGW